MFAEILVLFYV